MMFATVLAVALMCQVSETYTRATLDLLDGEAMIQEKYKLGSMREKFKSMARERLSASISKKYRLTQNQMVDIITNMNDQSLLDVMHLRLKATDTLPEVRLGIARVIQQECTCGTVAGYVQAVFEPEHMRLIDDITPVINAAHPEKEHWEYYPPADKPKHAAIKPILTLTKVEILEIIKPNDPRFRNHNSWIVAMVYGKKMYLQNWGLKNTPY
jgi:hypothetical protein